MKESTDKDNRYKRAGKKTQPKDRPQFFKDRIRLITRALAAISALLFVVVGLLYARKPISAVNLLALCIVLAIFDLIVYWVYELSHDGELSCILLVWLSGCVMFLTASTVYNVWTECACLANTDALLPSAGPGNEIICGIKVANVSYTFLILGNNSVILETAHSPAHMNVLLVLGDNLPSTVAVSVGHDLLTRRHAMGIQAHTILAIDRTNAGVYVSADLYNDAGRLLAEVKRNQFVIPSTVLCERPDLSTVSVRTWSGRELLYVEYARPNVFHIRGRFGYPGLKPFIVNDDITVDQNLQPWHPVQFGCDAFAGFKNIVGY